MIVAASGPEAALAALLDEPIEGARSREATALERILHEAPGGIVLVGTGSLGTRALACLRSIGVEPIAFADNAPERWGQRIDGLTVLSPAQAIAHAPEATFFVTIWNAGHSYALTKHELEADGAHAVVSSSALQWRFADRFLPFFSLDLPHRLLGDRDAIRNAAGLWSDEQSRDAFIGHVRWRLRGEFEAIPARSPQAQYFPDFIRLHEREAFVDCGAYDGDTLREFLRRVRGFGRYVAFEPAAQTAGVLQSFVAGLPATSRERIEIIRAAASDRIGTLRFDAIAGTGARASETGSFEVAATTIDATCRASRTTFIKMDVEGAENEALIGARATIARDRPILAVAAYHRPADLWRLPLRIAGMAANYRFYLRSHECDGWETVVYAVPAERAILPEGSRQ